MQVSNLTNALGHYHPIFQTPISKRNAPDTYFFVRPPRDEEGSRHLKAFERFRNYAPTDTHTNAVLDSRFGPIPYTYRNKGTRTATFDFKGDDKLLRKVLDFIRCHIPEVSLEYDEPSSDQYLLDAGLRGITTLLMRNYDIGVTKKIPFMGFRADGIYYDRKTGLKVEIGENTVTVLGMDATNEAVNTLFNSLRRPIIEE